MGAVGLGAVGLGAGLAGPPLFAAAGVGRVVAQRQRWQ